MSRSGTHLFRTSYFFSSIFLFCFFLLTTSLGHADSIAVATFSFSESADWSNASFAFSNLTDTPFVNSDILYRLQTGGVLDGYVGTIAPFQTFSFSVAPMFYQYGQFVGELASPTFTVGEQQYKATSTQLSLMLWSDTQGELGPGQSVTEDLYVNAAPIATPVPEPGTLALASSGIAAALLRKRVIPSWLKMRQAKQGSLTRLLEHRFNSREVLAEERHTNACFL